MPTKRKSRRRRSSSARSTTSDATNGNQLMHGLKFREVPIIEIDVVGDNGNILTTENFIDKISEYSQRDLVAECGGFLVMRPRRDQRHRYLIDPQKIPQFDVKTHDDKHYHFHDQRGSHRHPVQYNKEWVHDIPQLSEMVDGKPLMVGSYPQKVHDVLPPLLTQSTTDGNGKSYCAMPELFRQQNLSRKFEAFQAKTQSIYHCDETGNGNPCSSSSNTSDDASIGQVVHTEESSMDLNAVNQLNLNGIRTQSVNDSATPQYLLPHHEVRHRKRKRNSSEEQDGDNVVIQSRTKRRKFVLPNQVKVPLQSTSFELPLEVLHWNDVHLYHQDVTSHSLRNGKQEMDVLHAMNGGKAMGVNVNANEVMGTCISRQDEWCKSREEEQFKFIPQQALCALNHSEKRHDEISCGSEHSIGSRSSHSFPTSLGSTASTTSCAHHSTINTISTSMESATIYEHTENAQNTMISNNDDHNSDNTNNQFTHSSKPRGNTGRIPLIDRDDLSTKIEEIEPLAQFIGRPPVQVQEEKDGDVIVLTTNIPNQLEDDTYHPTVTALDKILNGHRPSSRCASPPITIVDIAMAESTKLCNVENASNPNPEPNSNFNSNSNPNPSRHQIVSGHKHEDKLTEPPAVLQLPSLNGMESTASIAINGHHTNTNLNNFESVDVPYFNIDTFESRFASTSNIKHESSGSIDSIPIPNNHKSSSSSKLPNDKLPKSSNGSKSRECSISTQSISCHSSSETVHDITSLTASHTDIDTVPLEHFRGFAFMVNQSGQGDVPVSRFWDKQAFEESLNHSPYDNASAEMVPLIFAKHHIRGHVVPYGIIENNITMYEEKSPLDLINLSLQGPFAEFNEGGNANEYMEGVHQPYIYLGNAHTWFAWHREDMNLYAVNHMLWGCDKIWYCIPPRETRKVMDFVRRQYSTYCGNVDDCFTPLQHKQFWFDPYSLLCQGIEVLFFRQKAGDIMITPPGGFHCGLNTGPNMAESLNFMTYATSCWTRCLSAFYFGLFNNPQCDLCRRSVLFDVHQLAERCRKSRNEKQRQNAPKLDIIPLIPQMEGSQNIKTRRQIASHLFDESQEEPQATICDRLVIEQRHAMGLYDNAKEMRGEKFWVYPVRSGQKFYYPAVWLSACLSVDDLQFEIRYQFKYLDSGTKKGRNCPEYVSEHEVLWDKGMLMRDWNRQQRFKPDKRSSVKYRYSRKQGNMLLDYCEINKGEYKHMYYLKKMYYKHYPEEIQFKDLFKTRCQKWRTKKQMLAEIDEQHRYFMRPLVSTSEEDTETEEKTCLDTACILAHPMGDPEICIFDRVTLKNQKQGEVQFMGIIEGKEGIFYGVKLDGPDGKNDGSVGDIKYFECFENYGIFVTTSKITKSESTEFNAVLPRVCIGERIYVNNLAAHGTLHFVGSIADEEGCWYGIELEDPMGEHNGCLEDRQYFQCSDYCGIFCEAKHVESIRGSRQKSQSDIALIDIDSTLNLDSVDDTKKPLLLEVDIETMTFMQVQARCGMEGLDTSGTIEQLLERLRHHLDPELHNIPPEKDDFYQHIETDVDHDDIDISQRFGSVIYKPSAAKPIIHSLNPIQPSRSTPSDISSHGPWSIPWNVINDRVQPQPERDWICLPDHGTGKMYYANLKTNATRWDPPPGFESETRLQHLTVDNGNQHNQSNQNQQRIDSTLSNSLTKEDVLKMQRYLRSFGYRIERIFIEHEISNYFLSILYGVVVLVIGLLIQLTALVVLVIGLGMVHHKPSPPSNRSRSLSFGCPLTKLEAARWEKAKCTKSGREYWYHKETKETTWSTPPAVLKLNAKQNIIGSMISIAEITEMALADWEEESDSDCSSPGSYRSNHLHSDHDDSNDSDDSDESEENGNPQSIISHLTVDTNATPFAPAPGFGVYCNGTVPTPGSHPWSVHQPYRSPVDVERHAQIRQRHESLISQGSPQLKQIIERRSFDVLSMRQMVYEKYKTVTVDDDGIVLSPQSDQTDVDSELEEEELSDIQRREMEQQESEMEDMMHALNPHHHSPHEHSKHQKREMQDAMADLCFKAQQSMHAVPFSLIVDSSITSTPDLPAADHLDANAKSLESIQSKLAHHRWDSSHLQACDTLSSIGSLGTLGLKSLNALETISEIVVTEKGVSDCGVSPFGGHTTQHSTLQVIQIWRKRKMKKWRISYHRIPSLCEMINCR